MFVHVECTELSIVYLHNDLAYHIVICHAQYNAILFNFCMCDISGGHFSMVATYSLLLLCSREQ